MEQPETGKLANALLAAPAWARVGLTAPTPTMREAAAKELALCIGELCGFEVREADPRQITLPL